MTDTTPVLGWHRPQRRSRIARLYPAPKAPLRSVMHAHGPVLNQGQIGCCTGNDVIDCLNAAPLLEGPFDEQDARGVYSLATRIDNIPGQWPPDDTGSTNIAAAKAAVRLGLASGYTHCQTFEHFLAALVLQPVMFASEWTADMFHPAPDGQVRPTGPVQGGHSYAAIGLDVEQERVWFLNSWGSSWGVGGTFWLSFADAASLQEGPEMIALHAGMTQHRQRAPRGCL